MGWCLNSKTFLRGGGGGWMEPGGMGSVGMNMNMNNGRSHVSCRRGEHGLGC